MSKRLDGNIGCTDKNFSRDLNGFPNVGSIVGRANIINRRETRRYTVHLHNRHACTSRRNEKTIDLDIQVTQLRCIGFGIGLCWFQVLVERSQV